MKSKSRATADMNKILSAIGHRVSFNYADEGVLKGTLTDRVVVQAGDGYYQVIDLIEFPDGKWIRMGFYRRVGGRLIWASRSAPTFHSDDWKAIFVKAKDKSWFGKLLKETTQRRLAPPEQDAQS